MPVAVRRPLRHEPPDLGTDLVVRERLIPTVRGRFDRPLTIITAGAGFGKTTLLGQAVAENRIERWGEDAWLQLQPADRQVGHLLAGIARSITGTDRAEPASIEEIVDLLLSASPAEVALILDDTHVLGDEQAAWGAVEELLAGLPANAHLVLAGRTPPPLPVARLLASGDAVVLDEGALAFDGPELEAFGAQRDLPADLVAELPGWPALATLQGQVGHAASTAFVWEEVLAPMAPERLRLLALAAPFELIDDRLLEALDPTWASSAADLVDGLPLVQGDGRGAFRLHALFGEALASRPDPTDRRRTLAAAARRLLDAGADRRAVEAAALAGDDDVVRAAVCGYFRRQIRAVTIPDVAAVHQRLSPAQRSSALGCFVDAALQWGADSRDAIARFGRADEQARAEGDLAVEALAQWRLIQLRYLEDPASLVVDERHDELASAGVPLGRSVPAFIRSVRAQEEGDVAGALDALDGLDDSDPDQRRETVAVRHFDLGRPEFAATSLEALLADGVVDLFAAQSLWLCGIVPLEGSWEVARTFPGAAGRAGVVHDQLSLLSIVAMVATQVGEDEAAAALLARSTPMVPFVGTEVAAVHVVSRALHELSVVGEDAARTRLDELVEVVPLGRFPRRSHLYGLCALRALHPAGAVLDRVDLGPTLRAAVAAGRAVEAAREGDLQPAAGLAWGEPDPLRANVPPPLLAELALAAVTAGRADARAVLDGVPHLRRWLERLSSHPAGAVARAADDLAATLPARPGYDVTVTMLGGLGIARSDGVEVDATRTARKRVRQLLAHLALRRRVPRAELAAALWPDLPAEKAATNLRVNLHHLQQALQAEREPSDPPWFVQTSADAVWLSQEGIDIDVHRFDGHLRSATELEAAGLPSRALVDLRAACDLYAGDLLPGLDDHVIELERARVRSLAVAARCRAGELVLAQGEPEAAMHDAIAALRMEPLSERATRLFVRCHQAVGSTDSARQILRRLLEQLAAAALTPDWETVALARRLDVVG